MRSDKVLRTYCPTGAAEAKDKGRSAAPPVCSPRSMLILSALTALVLFAGCDWLLGLDTTPPTCEITSPADSSSVDGVVPLAAIATDSTGVQQVEFYADGSLVGADSTAPYSASWDASGLAEHTWHSLSCMATDFDGNRGYSDTIAVQIAAVGQTSVFHGELDVPARSSKSVWFNATAGDTLSGDAMVVSGGTLSSFLWLDQDNYQKYVANQSYSALFRQDSFSQMSMRQAVAAAGRFYLVFANAGSAAVTCWARFVLE
jgi:hypothetical protein